MPSGSWGSLQIEHATKADLENRRSRVNWCWLQVRSYWKQLSGSGIHVPNGSLMKRRLQKVKEAHVASEPVFACSRKRRRQSMFLKDMYDEPPW